MVCTGDICPHCTECTSCHRINQYDQRANCRAKHARQCSHWRRARKVAYRAQQANQQDISDYDVGYDEPLGKEETIDHDDPIDQGDDGDKSSSSATAVSKLANVKRSQAHDAFPLQHFAQPSQYAQQSFSAQFHHPPPPHQLYAAFYQPSNLPQHPIFHQPQPSFYKTPPMPQQQPYLFNQPTFLHPPIHTSYTWIQQPMPPAHWPCQPYLSYPLQQPYPTYGPAPGTQTYRDLRVTRPKLPPSQKQSQILPCVAATQSSQPLQATQDAQIADQTQLEQDIQASRLAAKGQLEHHAQFAQAALTKSQTKTEQQDQKAAGYRGPRSKADQDRDTLGVRRFADQHEIRAAYWEREFQCHPARHRKSTSAFRALMAEKLTQAQEAVDRLGGFVGMSWGVWEGLDEYSNHYHLTVEQGKG